MGLSLVAVFAIIATLGLLSLNQATPAEAAEPVSFDFTGTVTFYAPEDLDEDDEILVVLNYFMVASPRVTMTVNGEDYMPRSVTATDNEAVTETHINIALEAGAGNEIANGAMVAIEITDGVMTPSTEGMYPISVSIDIKSTGDALDTLDHDGLGMMTVNVENMVSNIRVSLMEDAEDAASDLEVVFDLPSDVGLTTRRDDTITMFLGSFTTSGIDASEVEINGREVSPGSVSAEMVTSPDGDPGLLVEIPVPDMSDAAGTQAIDQGAEVRVTFSEDSGLVNPSNGGLYRFKVWTSGASKHVERMTEEGDPIKSLIQPTMPDVESVLLANPVAGQASRITVRFVTDDNLVQVENNVGGMRIVMTGGTADTVSSTDMIKLTLEGFDVPDFFPEESVKINGRDVLVSNADSVTDEIDLELTHDISASRPVVVTFLESTGIKNPADAGTYTVKVSTTPEGTDAEYDMLEVMAAPPPVTIPPGAVAVTAEPNTAGSATKLTVQFTTGDEGALAEDDEITVMAPGFSIPNSIDSDDVTVNGANAKSVAVSGTEVILTLDAGIPADRRVSVVFKIGAGLTTPAKAGQVEVSVSTTSEGQAASGKLAIMEAPEAAEIQAIEVVPQVPGEDSRITLKFMTPARLSSIENSEVIFRFHDDFDVTGGRVDVSKVTIQANSIFGGPEVDTPKASGVVNPTSATVTYETVDREPQIRLAVPDMADDEGDQHILQGAIVTVVFQQGSGIINPTEAGSYGIEWAINDDNNLNELDDVVLPTVVGLSGDGGKRGTSVTALAKGVEGGEAVLFWLDTATAKAGSKTYNAPDGTYDPNKESVLCRATAESNDTATCVFEVANPPFSPGVDLWVNVQDSEGRRVGILKGAASKGYDWVAIIKEGGSLDMHPINEAFVKLDARVSIQPSEVNIGDTVTVSMFDYPTGSPTDATPQVKIGSVTLDLNAQGVEFRQRTVQGTGEQSFTFSIPATVEKDGKVTPIPLGKVRVDVNKTCDGGEKCPSSIGDSTADTNITIAGATVTLSQPSILGNQTLSISGSGFSGRGAGNNRCINPGKVMINGVPVQIIEVEDSGQCNDAIELTSSGTFTLTVILREIDRWTGGNQAPLGIPDPLQTGGTHTVVITDTKGVEGRTTIEIPDRTLDVNPKTARPRTAVTVSGRNFVADNPDGSSVAVDLKYDCGGSVRRTVSAEPDASGNFEETLRVPDDCGIPSTNTITATVVIDGEPTTTETTTHDIPEAEVMVAPAQGAIGSEINITGEGFRTFEGVSGIELGTKNVLGARVFYTDRDGKLDIGPFLVPGIDPGTYALVVGVGEAEERTTASVNYTVIDEGLPQKAPVAIVEGLEPLGEKLVRVFRFNNATKTWEFYDPRPEFAEANTITQMFGGNVYWLNITEDVEVVLGGKTRRLTCIEGDCWNQIVW